MDDRAKAKPIRREDSDTVGGAPESSRNPLTGSSNILQAEDSNTDPQREKTDKIVKSFSTILGILGASNCLFVC
jgi:hypothetical protein